MPYLNLTYLRKNILYIFYINNFRLLKYHSENTFLSYLIHWVHNWLNLKPKKKKCS